VAPGTQAVGSDELRVALVLNGGVSLAIWMSGVVTEVDALRATGALDPKVDSTAGAYRALTALLDVRVTVDVIAGTSAGGLNGALLGTAIACGNRLRGVRELWMDYGSLGGLMRTDKTLALSVLMGDGERGRPGLLEAVTTALKTASKPGGPEPPGDVRLTMTTTGILGVAEDELRDSYGGRAERIEHRWRFRFATPPPVGAAPAGRAAIAPESVKALARAARSSSSFPFAFEPSGIDPEDAAVRAALHTRGGKPVYPTEGLPKQRGVDGGVLDNSPLDIVLDDIAHRPATDLPARRAVVFVVPYPGVTGDAGTAKFDLRSVADTTFNLPREVPDLDNLNQVATYLAEHGARMQTYDRLMTATDLEAIAVAVAGPETPLTAAQARRVGRRVLSRLRAARAALSPEPADDARRAELRTLQLDVHRAISLAATDPGAAAVRDPIVTGQAALTGASASWERLVAADRILHPATGLGGDDDQSDLGFTFMRLCADATNPGAYSDESNPKGARATSPGAKLYGLQLGHFAGFVRRSWRANDWMFGRLDGAARIVDLLLDPRLLRQQATTRGQMRAALDGLGADRELLRERVADALRAQALPDPSGDDTADEQVIVGAVDDPARIMPGRAAARPSTGGDAPIADEPSRELLVWRHAWRIVLQTAVVRAELNRIGEAIDRDEHDGFHANPRPQTMAADASDADWLAAFGLYYGEISGKDAIKQLVSDEMAAPNGHNLEADGIHQAFRMAADEAGGLPSIARHLASVFDHVWRIKDKLGL
jgi:predicted acylesterase/phospholipase RssA